MKKALPLVLFFLLSLLSSGGFLFLLQAGLRGTTMGVFSTVSSRGFLLMRDASFMKDLLRAHFVPALFALIPGCLLLLLKRRAEKRAKWHTPVFYAGILLTGAAAIAALQQLTQIFALIELQGPAASDYQSFMLLLLLMCFASFFASALLTGLDLLLDAVSKKRGGEAPDSPPQPVL